MDFVTPTSSLDSTLPPPIPQIVRSFAAPIAPTHDMPSSSSGTDGLANGALEVRGSDVELEGHVIASLDGTKSPSPSSTDGHIRRSSIDCQPSVRLRNYVFRMTLCLDLPSSSSIQSLCSHIRLIP
ncbi:retrovirus-related Pol polyprotein from transposon TNT 1-94 [Sesbania bispinosa]|nr:retrovirus-related Pol polyprotein from transposon TNT 1-94 [Sesbania bispinosa]